MRTHTPEPVNLGDLLNRYLQQKGYTRHGAEALAAFFWAETVGPWYARHTEVVRVENGVLTVHCDSAPLAQQLAADSDKILARLNRRVAEQLATGAPADSSPDPPPVLRELRATSAYQGRGDSRFRAAPALDESRPPTTAELDSQVLSDEEEAEAQQAAAQIPDETLRRRFLAAFRANLRLRQWQRSHGWQPCPTCDRLLPPDEPECVLCHPPPAPLQVRQ